MVGENIAREGDAMAEGFGYEQPRAAAAVVVKGVVGNTDVYRSLVDHRIAIVGDAYPILAPIACICPGVGLAEIIAIGDPPDRLRVGPDPVSVVQLAGDVETAHGLSGVIVGDVYISDVSARTHGHVRF